MIGNAQVCYLVVFDRMRNNLKDPDIFCGSFRKRVFAHHTIRRVNIRCGCNFFSSYHISHTLIFLALHILHPSLDLRCGAKCGFCEVSDIVVSVLTVMVVCL